VRVPTTEVDRNSEEQQPAHQLTGSKVSGSLSPRLFQISQTMNQTEGHGGI